MHWVWSGLGSLGLWEDKATTTTTVSTTTGTVTNDTEAWISHENITDYQNSLIGRVEGQQCGWSIGICLEGLKCVPAPNLNEETIFTCHQAKEGGVPLGRWNCETIVTPEGVTIEDKLFSTVLRKYTNELIDMMRTGQNSQWLIQNLAFIDADAHLILNGPSECVSATIAAFLQVELYNAFSGSIDNVNWHDIGEAFQMVMVTPNYKVPIESLGHFNRFIQSPYPIFRLMALLAEATPKTDKPILGKCLAYKNRVGDPDNFDWPTILELIREGLSKLEAEVSMVIEPNISLVESVRDRWHALYDNPYLKLAAAVSDEIFYQYRDEHYMAGCNAGILSAYLLRTMWFARWDRNAWLERFISATTLLQFTLNEPKKLAQSKWPVWDLWELFQRLRRDPLGLPYSIDKRTNPDMLDHYRFDGVLVVAYVWGWMLPYAPVVKRLITTTFGMRMLLLGPCQECEHYLGAELGAMSVKYEVLLYYARHNQTVLWMDLDIGWMRSPMDLVKDRKVLTFASKDAWGNGVSPALIYVPKNPPREVVDTLKQILINFDRNPYVYDYNLWDNVLDHKGADNVGSWDYKGRDILAAPDERRISYWEGPHENITYELFDPHIFTSGEGWNYHGQEIHTIAAFHFASVYPETSIDLFEIYFQDPESFRSIIWRHMRMPRFLDTINDPPPEKPYFIQISYAHGCCEKSMKKNMESGKPYFDKQYAYGLDDIDEDFRTRNDWIFAEKKGAGLWIWKPYLILKTLQEAPEGAIVAYLDAGNHYIKDPRPLFMGALNKTDASAIRLGCCFEADWTKRETLIELGADRMSVTERMQMAGYFMLFRKNQLTLEFLQLWLGAMENPKAISPDVIGDTSNYPGFQRHMIDQSVFSVLFKKVGFLHMSLDEGHSCVALDRWRE